MKEKVIMTKMLKHYEGIEGLKVDALCQLQLRSERIVIIPFTAKQFDIDLRNLSNIAIISEQELVEKEKSVVLRGAIGSLFFGGGGLILGGLAGLRNKKVIKKVDYLIINYKDNEEEKVMSFVVKKGLLTSSFIDKVRKQIDSIEK